MQYGGGSGRLTLLLEDEQPFEVFSDCNNREPEFDLDRIGFLG